MDGGRKKSKFHFKHICIFFVLSFLYFSPLLQQVHCFHISKTTLNRASTFNVLMCTCSSSSVLWIGSAALITQYSQWMHRLVYTHHNKLHSPPSQLPHRVLLSVRLRVCSYSLLQHRFLFTTFHYAFLKGRHSVTASQHTHILYTTTHPSECVITRMLSTIQHLRWENNCYTCILLLFMPFNMCSGPDSKLPFP